MMSVFLIGIGIATLCCKCGIFCQQAQIGRTALIWAAANDHADCVRLLLDAGADTNPIDRVCTSVLLAGSLHS